MKLDAISRLGEGPGSGLVLGGNPRPICLLWSAAHAAKGSRIRQAISAATKPVGAFHGSLMYWVGLGLLQTGRGRQYEPRDRNHRTKQLDQLKPGLPRAQQYWVNVNVCEWGRWRDGAGWLPLLDSDPFPQ